MGPRAARLPAQNTQPLQWTIWPLSLVSSGVIQNIHIVPAQPGPPTLTHGVGAIINVDC